MLQHVGSAVQVVLSRDRECGESIAVSVLGRLEDRGAVGDDILAEDLLAQLQSAPLAAKHIPVDLAEVGSELSGNDGEYAACLDLQTGEVIPGALLDPTYVAEEDLVDVESEPDRWLGLDRVDSRAQWRDMAEFSARQTSVDLRRRLESAIEGKGAFRRFRDAVHDEDLVGPRRRFHDDREVGRARAYLAENGSRAVPPTPPTASA